MKTKVSLKRTDGTEACSYVVREERTKIIDLVQTALSNMNTSCLQLNCSVNGVVIIPKNLLTHHLIEITDF